MNEERIGKYITYKTIILNQPIYKMKRLQTIVSAAGSSVVGRIYNRSRGITFNLSVRLHMPVIISASI